MTDSGTPAEVTLRRALKAVIGDGFIGKLTLALIAALAVYSIPVFVRDMSNFTAYVGAIGIVHGWFWASLAALVWRDSNNV